MKKPPAQAPTVHELANLDAAELLDALTRHFASVGPLASDAERAIGRELISRAKRAEAAGRLLVRIARAEKNVG